jgi:hypothetical protein
VLLAVGDAATLALAVAGILALREVRARRVETLAQAFGALERSIAVGAPWLPQGSTWGETFERLKGAGVEADWSRMEKTLEAYEAFRFGGRPDPVEGKEEVAGLATRIQRGGGGHGPKGKSVRTD